MELQSSRRNEIIRDELYCYKFKLILQENSDVFATDNDNPGLANMPGFNARIELLDDKPVVNKGKRSYNVSQEKELRNTIEKHLRAGIIEESNSPPTR